MKKYDVVIIGGGAGGLTVASGAKSMGATVALIEKAPLLGGDCLHVGCVPSKAFIEAAKEVYIARTVSEQLGLNVSGEVSLAKINERVQQSVKMIQKHDSDERFISMGVDLYKGTGQFSSAHTVLVSGEEIYGKRIVIASGTRPFVPPIAGLAESSYWTNETLFEQTELPKELLVIGAGAIGLELSQAFSRLGSEVTVVEKAGTFLPAEDADIRAIALELLEQDSTIWLNTEVTAVKLVDGRKQVTIDRAGETITMLVDEILVASGRRPNSDQLALDCAGVHCDARGFIETNDQLQTSVPHIYAIGDVNGRYLFTHVAGEEGKTVVQKAILGIPKKMRYTQIPWTIYTSPEIFHFGLTEAEAAEAGLNPIVYKVNLDDVDRFVADHDTAGIVKVITNQKGKIIGAHAIGKGAGDWMQIVILAVKKGHKIGDLSQMIYPYPNHSAAVGRTADLYWREKLFNGKRPKWTEKYIRWFR